MKLRLPELLERIRGTRIGVVGDFCLDVYLALDPSASEVSEETGLPTRPVRQQRCSPGGAGNVAANLTTMGVGTVRAFGVIGDDPFGGELRRRLEALGVDAAAILVQPDDWQTCTYVKPLAGEREESRIDFGNFNALHPRTAEELLAALEESLAALDAVIINQQLLRGIHTGEFRRGLARLLARRPGVVWIVDSRQLSDEFPGAVRKLNDREGARLCGLPGGPDEPVSFQAAREIAERLYGRWGRPLFLTRGEFGCLVRDGEGLHEVPGLVILTPVDPVGAGDSMVAGIAAALAAGETPLGAAELGNFAAGVTVQQLRQTGTASPQQILAIGTDPDYRYRPDLALSPHRARFLQDTEIELVGPLPPRPAIRHAVFDHDGTISTLRQGWEAVMEAVMLRCILGERYEEIDEVTLARLEERVRDYIDRSTGVQTLVQMNALAGMVREAGHVPAGEVLDARGYKALFAREMASTIDRRIGKLQRGELDLADCTVKGAVRLLEELHRRGVRLYLASGTDHADVEREAQALGYAHLFEGHIYGSIGDISHEPKKVVLDRILAEIADGAIVTFGDGPVEIRESHKRGTLTVGVASDEVRRHGPNPAKRARLIQAGADLLVPDFSQLQPLLGLLFPGG